MARNMTVRGFLHKSNGKISAAGFLHAHKNWLIDNIGSSVQIVFDKIEEGNLLPEEALTDIRNKVYQKMLEMDISKINTPSRVNAVKESQSDKAVVCTLTDRDNNPIIEDGKVVRKAFDLSQRGIDWADRRLLDSPPGSYVKLLDNRTGKTEVITRDEAYGRIFKKKPMASHKVMAPSNSSLSFGMKAHQTRANFSRG